MNPNRIEPGPGQESVWDYPRPPRLEPCSRPIRIVTEGVTVAETDRSFRVLETSHPPVYYLPPDSVRMDLMRQSPRQGSFCEWKGRATYYCLLAGTRLIENAAWTYNDPTQAFQAIAGYLAFYPSKMDACFVDDERVDAQPGDFYGGWITSDVVGPFKGGAGTMGW